MLFSTRRRQCRNLLNFWFASCGFWIFHSRRPVGHHYFSSHKCCSGRPLDCLTYYPMIWKLVQIFRFAELEFYCHDDACDSILPHQYWCQQFMRLKAPLAARRSTFDQHLLSQPKMLLFSWFYFDIKTMRFSQKPASRVWIVIILLPATIDLCEQENAVSFGCLLAHKNMMAKMMRYDEIAI